jgi:hypothetical protein
MRKIILTTGLALITGLAFAPTASQAREALVYGQTWRMPQDLARMDAPQPQSALTIAEQRARRAAYQASKARNFPGIARRASR